MGDLHSALRQSFRHEQFREGQQTVVSAVLSGRDVLAVMPTGSGKSLGYQLPAVMLPGTTIVVSPLISLMKDQVDELTRRDIAAGALHSMLASDDRHRVVAQARAGRLRLLYVAPERFPPSGSRCCCVTFRCRASSSTKRIACRSGDTTSAQTIAGSPRLRRRAAEATGKPGGRQ